MRRWIPVALLLVLCGASYALATGSLTIPNVLGSQPPGNYNASNLDTNWSTIATYVNAREITIGLAAARPAAGTAGRYYFSTDANGGTLYVDTGSAWQQIAPALTTSVGETLTGLTLSPDGSSGATLNIEAGGASSDDATIGNRILMVLGSNYAKTLAAWAVGTAAGCLDTGSAAASTWYHVYLIERVDTSVVDVLCSTNASSPTMPTNYTKKRRIGSILTDTLIAINPFTQYGDEFRWATVPALNVDDTSVNGTTAVTATATTPNGVVTNALLNVCLTGAPANRAVHISALAAADQAASATVAPLGSSGLGNAFDCTQTTVWTNTSRQFRYRASGTLFGLGAATVGWTDRRGRG